ncbi:MoaD/ThiS family protein [Desulfosediminicola flagellatus]|uniref:MoaD/ThiS family protein n=1 Tax=Desulfosediminicola flagellatus TaxID=2569541 RepID=UPI0010AC91BA|nr:MoaD/ThiS family protein [Desulfosediminicola flagellatus]
MGKDKHVIKIRLLAGLEKYGPKDGEISVAKDETILDIVHHLNLNSDLVQMAFVDGRFIEFDTPVGRAEKILLLPAIGGG